MEAIFTEADRRRARELEQFLPEGTFCPGVPYTDRMSWEQAFPPEQARRIVRQAEVLLSEPEVLITEEQARLFTTAGDRQTCDGLYLKAIERVNLFALAECIENEGRFLAAYEKAVAAQCAFRTWVLTGHDFQLDYYEGREMFIDLHSACISWELAVADYILSDKAAPEIRSLIRAEIARRTFAPFEAVLWGEREPMWWMLTDSNWNAVCLGTVLGAALALIPERSVRSVYLAAWEKLTAHYKSGFSEDGYCSEGLTYWGYGLSHYIYPAETLRQATEGRLDYFQDREILRDALYPLRIRLTEGVYPSIADCRVGTLPEQRPMQYVMARLFGERPSPCEDVTRLYAVMLFCFPRFAELPPCPVLHPDDDYDHRSWFESAGVLAARPGGHKECRLAVCMKGGSNRELHNHNDVGSFTVAVDNAQLIADIGHEIYCADTFNANRYRSPFSSSYGHSVPLPAGTVQGPAADQDHSGGLFDASVELSCFTEEEDRYRLNLQRAYPCEALLSLTREFRYSRLGQGRLTIVDCFSFSCPQNFEAAILTYGECEICGNQAVLHWQGESLRVCFSSDTGRVVLSAEKIQGNIAYNNDAFRGRVPTRLRAAVPFPTTAGRLVCVVEPIA